MGASTISRKKLQSSKAGCQTEHIEQIQKLLDVEPPDQRLVFIWGM
jgi:hypothetical protein